MAEATIGCLALINWIWTLVKRPFRSMVENSQDNQVSVVINASASHPSLATSVLSEMGSTRGGLTSSVAARMVASSSSARPWKYDVYLSFGGLDTRKGITFELYDRLQRSGIKTFMDDQDLEAGDAISPTLTEAIEDSRYSIVVLSRDYASSTWCLEELTTIYDCMKDRNRILPLLYHLETSDVRFCKRTFDEAFSKLETSNQQRLEEMQRWRNALEKVASFSLWNTQDYKTHKELVEVIVKFVCNKVLPNSVGSTEDSEGYEEPRQAMDEVMTELTIESSATRWKHDVFLSFRGPDTRKGIASYLFYELQGRNIRTFMDEEGLEAGTEISSNLLMAIRESRSAVVLLSPNYASSAWCLDELANIVQGSETRNTIVLPVFYNVEPSHVRHQMGKFKEAFTGHEQRHREKVNRWKAALTKVANLSGLELKKYGSERQLVEGIVQFVENKVRDLEIESPEDFVKFEATKEAMVKVMKALKDDEVTAVGLYGMAGIGKTVMAEHVAAEAKRIGLFHHVLTAVVTHEPVLENIQGQLAAQLGVQLDEKQPFILRARRLSKEIMSRKKILIILDDIWNAIDLSRIGIPIYKKLQYCNSKVLLTTRSSKVCNSMDSRPKISLSFLSDDDSWDLFLKKTRMSSEQLTVYNDAARILVKECSGLPIALVAIARALCDKEVNEWKEAAVRLQSSQPSDLDDVVFNCIKLSYDQLTSKDAKLCFLLCCLFPEDYDIQIEELMRYAVGKGLFLQYNTLQEARNICRSAVRDLKSSSLLLGTKHDGQVRMHDVVRDVARLIWLSEDGQSVLVEAGRQLRMWPKINGGYCAISLMMNKIRKLPDKLVCSELKILLLQGNPNVSTIPESFLECLRELSILNLSQTSISVLPPSFSLLDNLHSLYLDYCAKISDISVLGELQKLQILSLRECCPQEVPEEIGRLTSLRMLDISESPVVKIASQVISRLSELEELYMQCDFADWRNVEEAGKETNVGFDELTGLSYLRILKVGIPNAIVLPKHVKYPPDWLYFDICISSDSEVRESTWKPHSSHNHSRTLTLGTTIRNLPEWFIDVVTEKAEKLQYRKCKDLENILVEYDSGRLNELRHLFIIGPHENLIEVMNADARDSNNAAFPNLEELHLLDVKSIKNLCVGKLPPWSLRKLKLLDVRKCHNLVGALLQSSLLERLQYLEKLLCAHLYGLEYVFGSGKTTTCEKLQEMRLCRLPELRKIWSVHAPHAISSNLKILAVSGCKELKSLFTSDMACVFSQLEDLWVHSNFSLDRIVEASEETGKRNVIFPKLKNLVLEYLPRLRRLYSNSSGGPTSLEIKFPSLEYFYNVQCPRFSPSAPNFHSTKQVQVNDVEHYSSLKTRLCENLELDHTISEDGRRPWKYDVYLNGNIDPCQGIMSKLYDQLQKIGIKSFIGRQDLQEGDSISTTPLTAIEGSRFAIVVLSPNYGSSTWCLEELAKIYECMEDRNIFPLFYHVEPADVRYQKIEDAFTQHENSRQHGDKVDTWRDVLKQVTNLSGWHTQSYKADTELLAAIVDHVLRKVSPTFEVFEATRQALDEVMNALKDDEVTAVGVYGMGGVGKTTLVEHVGAQARTSGIFGYVTKSVVSQNPVFKNLQDTLAEQLGFEIPESTEVGRAIRLRKEIKKREKILLILDDIWERLDLSRIGIPTYKELQKCNSKVLLTTRIRDVCHQMECQRKIALNVLSEQDSWALFARTAGRSFESPTFEDVAKKVAKECNGLPSALTTVARALGDKDLVEWKRAVQRLMKSQTANPDDKGEVFQCIKLSYDFLKDEDSKSLFLLCCLFPEDYAIPIEGLVTYAIGKGLFQDAESIEEARAATYSVVKYLKSSSLLLDSEEDGCVKMHDVVRDMALRIAISEARFLVKAGCGLENWPRVLHEDCVAISLMKNDICNMPEKLPCPKLQVLLLNYNYVLDEMPEAFFQSLNELRVLDFSWTGISILPRSFGLLTCLQALYLDGCERITDFSMVGKLTKLEILSIRDAILKELPREVGNLTNLRLLDITGGIIARVPSKLISRLQSLEELYLKCGFGDWGSKVNGEGDEINAGFDEVMSLSKLRRLEVWISNEKCIPKFVGLSPNWVDFVPKFIISIGKHERMEASYKYGQITLTLDCISNFPDWFFKAVMNKAETLKWIDCPRTGLIDVFVEYEHGRLHGLKHLTVSGRHNEDELMNTSTWVPKEPVFKNLEELLLWRVELYAVVLPAGSLCNLKLLEVRSCYNWGDVLLRSTLLQGLPNLEELKCDSMDEIEYVFPYEVSLDVKHLKLRTIGLSNLERVRSICEGPAPPAMFQNLQSLSIKRCNLQGSLFPYDIAQRLFQLNILVLKECPLLERIVEASNEKIILPKLKQLSLTELPVLYYGSASFDIECPSLEELHLWNCPKFSVSVPADFHSMKQIQLT